MTESVRKKYWICFLIMGIVLLVDQVVKILVKTRMQIGEEIPLIGSWCCLHFIENEGMAFGMAFGGKVGKLILSLIRIAASVCIMWFLLRKIRKDGRMLLLVSLSLILVGAVGNLLDSCFYGIIFNESYYHVAEMFPADGGYAPFLFGRVVDMFYFPIIDTTWPQWVPFVGGRPFQFFNAIFNVADSAITVGTVLLIIDQLFVKDKEVETEQISEEKPVEEVGV